MFVQDDVFEVVGKPCKRASFLDVIFWKQGQYSALLTPAGCHVASL